jgi:TRAP-type uncharacterized transport system substrate-binding protein
MGRLKATSAFNLFSMRPIRTLADLQGLRVGGNDGIEGDVVRALGAIPVPGSSLEKKEAFASGALDAMIVYYTGGVVPAPWLSQASLAVDWAGLNPSADELATLKKKGFAVEEIDAAKLGKKDIHVKKLTLSPFYWGFDIGMNMPTDDVYKMLTIVDKNADNLAKLDGDFAQISGGKLAEFQTKALEQTWDLIPIHPGLAKFLKEKGKWNPKWDSKVAAM